MEGKAHFKIGIFFGIIPMSLFVSYIYYYLYSISGCLECLIWNLPKSIFWISIFLVCGTAFPDFDWKFGRHRHPLFHSGIIPLTGFIIWILDIYLFENPIYSEFSIIFSSFCLGFALHLLADIIPPGENLSEKFKKLIAYIKRNDAPGNITGIKKEFTWLFFWGICLITVSILSIMIVFL